MEERDFLDFLLFPPVCSTGLLEELLAGLLEEILAGLLEEILAGLLELEELLGELFIDLLVLEEMLEDLLEGILVDLLTAGVVELVIGVGATFIAQESEKTFPILSKPHLAFLYPSHRTSGSNLLTNFFYKL